MMSKSHTHSHAHPSSPSKRKELLEHAVELLRKFDLKRTKPREALLEFLIKEHGPFSIEEIVRSIKKRDLDVVTVYRCLAAFEKLHLVRRCDFGDGIARYEFQADQDHHHHHVVCTKCRKTENLESCTLPDFESKVRDLGYSDVIHSLEFFGICKKCRNSGKS